MIRRICHGIIGSGLIVLAIRYLTDTLKALMPEGGEALGHGIAWTICLYFAGILLIWQATKSTTQK